MITAKQLSTLSRVFYSLILVLAGAGCASRPPTPPPTALNEVQAIFKQYAPFRSVRGLEVTRRLTATLGEEIQPAIIFVKADRPLAFAFPPNSIVISTALVAETEHEAELAFVLGHELAHLRLQHYQRLAESPPPDRAERLNYELEADRAALGMILRAGYDPYVSLQVINRLRFHIEDEGSHPTLNERLVRLSHILRTVRWTPPGRASSREFDRFRRELLDE